MEDTNQNIYKTPEANLDKAKDQGIINYKLYKISGIGIATFFGSILAGGLLVSKNFKNLGKDSAARNTLIYSFLATIIIIAVAYMIPDDWHVPNMSFTLPQLIVMVQLAKKHQEKDIEDHVAMGGLLASNWKAFGISLLVMIGILAALFPVILLFTQ